MVMTDDLVYVGRDCACGHPLVRRDGVVVCAVYGTHPPIRHRLFGLHNFEPKKVAS